jgi:hypothetical protein
MTDNVLDFNRFLEIICDEEIINENTSIVWHDLSKKKMF